MVRNKHLVSAIYNKRLEVHYNEWYVRGRNNKKIKLELQGKIKCPLINIGISSLTCSKLMDNEDWPRGIDPNICKKCNCFVSLSIAKFQERKEKSNANRTESNESDGERNQS